MPGASPTPWRLGGLSAREVASRVGDRAWTHEIPDRAAALSYYFLFALFPTLLLLAGLLGMLGTPHLIDRLMVYAADVLPPDVATLVARTLHEVVTDADDSVADESVFSIGLLGVLWAASRGVSSAVAAINVVYGVADPRPWWRRQLLAIGMTVALCLFLLTALILLTFGEAVGYAVASWADLGVVFSVTWALAQWPVAMVLAVVGMDLTYHLAPAVRTRLRWLSPGAVVALIGWVVASLGLRFYVHHFADYNATYGSIGAVVLLMIWLYITAGMLLLGAEINAVIARADAARVSL